MNTKQLQYAVLLSQILNISQTAEMLNMTQPALSKQILRLETELGVTLFDRSTTPLTLTQAGEEFMKNAKEILLREESLCRSMEEFKSGGKGRLIIGISPFRATYFLSDVIIKLREKYPGLQVVLSEKNSTLLQKDTADGLLDFSILNLPVDEAVFDVIPLRLEPVVLVVPEALAKGLAAVKTEGEEFPVIDLSLCGQLPFITLGKTQELRLLFDRLCVSNGFVPNIAAEVVGISTAFNLAREGVGAALLPLQFTKGNMKDSNLKVFTLKSAACIRQPAVVMRKGRYTSKYAAEAVKLITDTHG